MINIKHLAPHKFPKPITDIMSSIETRHHRKEKKKRKSIRKVK